jgi:hypothetical protein
MQAAYAYRYLKADAEVFSVLYAVKPYGHLIRWEALGREHEIRFMDVSLQNRSN